MSTFRRTAQMNGIDVISQAIRPRVETAAIGAFVLETQMHGLDVARQVTGVGERLEALRASDFADGMEEASWSDVGRGTVGSKRGERWRWIVEGEQSLGAVFVVVSHFSVHGIRRRRPFW